MSVINDRFNELIENKITSWSFDIINNVITLKIAAESTDGSVKERTVELLKVATAYYVNSSSRKHFTPWMEDGCLELTGAFVLDESVDLQIVASEGKEWIKDNSGGANIILSIWDETVLIEAAEVRVDGESFVIGDW